MKSNRINCQINSSHARSNSIVLTTGPIFFFSAGNYLNSSPDGEEKITAQQSSTTFSSLFFFSHFKMYLSFVNFGLLRVQIFECHVVVLLSNGKTNLCGWMLYANWYVLWYFDWMKWMRLKNRRAGKKILKKRINYDLPHTKTMCRLKYLDFDYDISQKTCFSFHFFLSRFCVPYYHFSITTHHSSAIWHWLYAIHQFEWFFGLVPELRHLPRWESGKFASQFHRKWQNVCVDVCMWEHVRAHKWMGTKKIYVNSQETDNYNSYTSFQPWPIYS